MKKQTLKTLILILIQLNVYLNAIDFDEHCFIGEKSFLQFAIVIDRTGTFLFDSGDRSFYKQFSELLPTLFSEINKDYPGSEFAATCHADWESIAAPPIKEDGQLHNEPEGCYTRLVRFTKDTASFVTGFLDTTVLGSGRQENGLSALAFTAADAKLGWIRDETPANGRRVRRVLLLVTDEDDLLFLGKPNVPKPRGEFRGDGTDTCRTSKPPTHEKLREVFEKYEMTVLSLLAVTESRKNVTELYQEHFQKIGGTTKYCGRPFALKTGDIDNPGQVNQYDELVQFVKDCLLETDSNACIFGDPEGFNTLGL